MSITSANEFVTAAIIDGRQKGARSFCAVCFWLWGIVGFAASFGSFFSLTGNIGVGTSAYLAAGSLLWIGGMVLFGMGALIAKPTYEFRRPNSMS